MGIKIGFIVGDGPYLEQHDSEQGERDEVDREAPALQRGVGRVGHVVPRDRKQQPAQREDENNGGAK